MHIKPKTQVASASSSASYLGLVDLYSMHGTRLNDAWLKAGQVYPLFDDDVLRFGRSERRFTVSGIGRQRSALDVIDAGAEPSGAVSHKRQRDSATDLANGHASKNHKPDKVTASHILLKHSASRNPCTHRSTVPLTRTVAEATQRMQQFESELRALPDDAAMHKRFGQIAFEVSDCSSFKRQGDLGSFEHGKMQKPFANAAFALRVGEMSSVVTSDSGVHLILRTK